MNTVKQLIHELDSHGAVLVLYYGPVVLEISSYGVYEVTRLLITVSGQGEDKPYKSILQETTTLKELSKRVSVLLARYDTVVTMPVILNDIFNCLHRQCQ